MYHFLTILSITLPDLTSINMQILKDWKGIRQRYQIASINDPKTGQVLEWIIIDEVIQRVIERGLYGMPALEKAKQLNKTN